MSAIFTPSFRTRRVAAMLLLMVVLSLLDLTATLHAMRTTGMFEANPVAAAIARGSPTALAAYKVASLVFSVTILFALRRSWQAETAAAVSVLVLIGVTLAWGQYLATVHRFDDQTMQTIQTMTDPHPSWVRLN
jgi:hypothetical protein